MKRSTAGFSLIEIMAVLSIFSILSVVIFNSLKGMKTNHAVEENEASIDLREIIKQELVLQGVNVQDGFKPLIEYGDIDATIIESESKLNIVGKNQISLLNIAFNEERERINIAGKIIKDGIEPIPYIASQLSPPKANYFNKINLSLFPFKDFIVRGNSNPIGTYYRYTRDGSDPDNSSAIWDFSALTLANWSPLMKFRAFHANSRFLESDVLSISLKLEVAVTLKREDGSNSLDISYYEIVNNYNRILIVAPLNDPNVHIHYRIRGGSDIEYTGPFHLPLWSWNAYGNILIVEVRTSHSNIPICSQEFHLYIEKEQLPMPQIWPSGGALATGSRIEIRTDRNIATTNTVLEGEENGIFLYWVDL